MIFVLCRNKAVFGEQPPGAVNVIDKRRNMERPYLLKLGQSEPFGNWLGQKCFDMQRNERFTRALQLFTARGEERLDQHAGAAGAPAAAGAGATSAASQEAAVDVEMYASPPASPLRQPLLEGGATAATQQAVVGVEMLVSPTASPLRQPVLGGEATPTAQEAFKAVAMNLATPPASRRGRALVAPPVRAELVSPAAKKVRETIV